MKILAIDLGKFQSVACVYGSSTCECSSTDVFTKPSDIHDLLATNHPQRVVIEFDSAAGCIHDLAVTMEIPIEVANSNHETWRWKNAKRKNDKDDALKRARLQMLKIRLDNLPHQKKIFFAHADRFVKYVRAVQAQRRTLPSNAHEAIARINPRPTFSHRSRRLFLSQSSSTLSRPICSKSSAELGSSVADFLVDGDSNTLIAPSSSSFFQSTICVG